MYQPSGLTAATSTPTNRVSCSQLLQVMRTTPVSAAPRPDTPVARGPPPARPSPSRSFATPGQPLAQDDQPARQGREAPGDQQYHEVVHLLSSPLDERILGIGASK